MAGNSFGHLFRFTTWGESHGPAIGCVVDGVPPRLALAEADIQPYLDRRRPGQSRHTTQRREPDQVRIVSGVFEGQTTGTPIALVIDNGDARRQGLRRHRQQVPPRPRRLHLLERNTASATRAAAAGPRRARRRCGWPPVPSPARCWMCWCRTASQFVARWCRWAGTPSTVMPGTGHKWTAIRSGAPMPPPPSHGRPSWTGCARPAPASAP